jgi:hypothetical protein
VRFLLWGLSESKEKGKKQQEQRQKQKEKLGGTLAHASKIGAEGAMREAKAMETR